MAAAIEAADAANGDAALGGTETYVRPGAAGVDTASTEADLTGSAVPGIPVAFGGAGAEDIVTLPYGTVGFPGFSGRWT